MKNKLILLTLVLMLCLTISLVAVACGGGDDVHVHIFSTEWSSDETYHWHAAACEHKDEIKDKEEHTFNGEICSKCGYNNHKHTFADTWEYDAVNHWHIATCEHTTELGNKVAHDFVDGICECGARNKASEGLKFSDTAAGTYSVSCGSATDEDIIIPEIYNGKFVTEIAAGGFCKCSQMTSIYIPKSVKIINDSAFTAFDYETGTLYTPENFTDITIAEDSKLETIGDSAFMMSNITSIKIPASVTTILDGAFYESKLRKVTFAEGNAIEEICYSVFGCCYDLTTINLPDSIKTIGTAAFTECNQLSISALPKSIENVGERAFSSCSMLTSLGLKDESKLASIGANAFFGCSSLTSVYIPACVTQLGSQAFDMCQNIRSVRFAENSPITKIEDKMFTNANSLTEVLLPKNLEVIGNEAFFSCGALRTINIPETVNEIGSIAFSSCSSLQTIHIPSGVTTIKNRTFSNCTNLQIVIGKNITTIENYAFWNVGGPINCVASEKPAGWGEKWCYTDTGGNNPPTPPTINWGYLG